MRIALVAENYYPHMGGIPEHVHHLALELNARGHDTVVITARMGDVNDAPFVRRIGRSLVIYANAGMARLTTGWRLTEQMARILRECRTEVMHVHGGLSPVLGIIGPWAAARVGIPVVATHHSWFPRSVGYRLFRRPLQKLLDQHAASIAVSSAAVDAMSRYFTTPWVVIPNGVDVDLFNDRGRPGATASGDRPRLLFLGRLEPRTGLDVVLKAMPKILARFPGAELMVAGAGPWLRHYRKYAAGLGVHATFLGRVLEERPALYRNADIYLCPTNRASFGVTLLEAMACGAPIVASDLPAFREVAGNQAVLVPAADPDAWAAETIALLADPSRREAMSRAGREAALGFAWPRIADRLLEVYHRALGTRPPRASARLGRPTAAGSPAS